MTDDSSTDVRELLATLGRGGATVGVAESLTGGLLVARLVDVPGASAVVRGGVVAYATDLKQSLLGVPGQLLEERGAVDPDVAAAMAVGVAQRLGTTYGVSTTGVAGPDPQDGRPPGTVHVAVAGPGGVEVRSPVIPGGRDEVRRGAVEAALALLSGVLPHAPE